MLTTRRAVIVSCLLFAPRLAAEQGLFGGGPDTEGSTRQVSRSNIRTTGSR